MKLSIIVPVYNVEKYLSDCLNSLLDQGIDESEYEIICVNDGSSDTSLQILQKYAKNHNNIVIIDKNNEGVSAARNVGIKVAKGDFIVFCDSDDCWRTGSLGQIMDFASKNDLQIIIMKTHTSVATTYKYEKDTVNELSFDVLDHSNYSARNACFLITKKSIIEENHIEFRNGMKYGEDTLFAGTVWFYASKINAKIAVLNSPIYYYRANPNSAMSNLNRDKHLEDMYIMAKEYNKLLKQGNSNPDVTKTLKERIGAAVSGMLYDNLKNKQYTPKELFDILEKEELYPISSQWWAVKSAKSYKTKLVNIWKYTFKYKLLYKIYYTVMN